MTSVCTVIVAVTSRYAHAMDLALRIGADRVFVDTEGIGEWPMHERALRWALVTAAEKKFSHVLVVRDDAVPVDLFRTAVAGVAALRPDDMVGLYVGTYRPHRDAVTAACAEADRVGAMWLTHHELLWGVATLIPVVPLAEVLDVAARSNKPYDLRMGRAWAKVTEKPVVYVWPSLVDHRDEASVIPRRVPTQGVRVARRVGISDGDPNVSVPIVTYMPSRRPI